VAVDQTSVALATGAAVLLVLRLRNVYTSWLSVWWVDRALSVFASLRVCKSRMKWCVMYEASSVMCGA
jgi:hypothetical protein